MAQWINPLSANPTKLDFDHFVGLALKELRHAEWIRRVLVQTPLGAEPGLGAQPRHEAKGDLQCKNWYKSKWLTG